MVRVVWPRMDDWYNKFTSAFKSEAYIWLTWMNSIYIIIISYKYSLSLYNNVGVGFLRFLNSGRVTKSGCKNILQIIRASYQCRTLKALIDPCGLYQEN